MLNRRTAGLPLFIAIPFLAATFGHALSAPNRVRATANPEFAERDGVLYYRTEPFTGVRIETFPDGSSASETSYFQGLRDGASREYGTTGALRARWNYRAGKKDGLQEGWFLEGPKRFEQHYRDGILEGTVTEWHLNGNVFNQQTYVNGAETARKIYYPTAEVFSNYVKRDGRTYGLNGGELCFEKKKDGER